MRNALYVANYHDVSWEDSFLTRALYGTLRPDVFRDHLAWYGAHGDLVSTPEALARLERGEGFARPTFCLWFDDGFAGVRRHALPECRARGITAAQSLCSRFVCREEFYYLAKASYLAGTDGLRFLRSRLRTIRPDVPLKLREWMKVSFSTELVGAIDEVYRRFTTPAFRDDAWRLYDDADGNRRLAEEGWLIANHSAAHYPAVEGRPWEEVESDFRECGKLVAGYEGSDRYWVSPFSFVPDTRREALKGCAVLVQVENRANTAETFRSGIVYRFDPGIRRTPAIPT